jgi:hypothetical protein
VKKLNNQIGRPIKPNALTRDGKLINFFLSKKDQEKLQAVCRQMRLTKSDALRELINKEFENLKYKI